jgi:hypothetical protein
MEELTKSEAISEFKKLPKNARELVAIEIALRLRKLDGTSGEKTEKASSQESKN